MSTILIEKNIMVPMRDGVQLATDIYWLEGASPTPVLVARTPYNKDGLAGGGEPFDILRAVQAGYTVVAQDVRGRYASEGAFNPHFQETDDGLDAFAWVAAQPWSNGVVGTFVGWLTQQRMRIGYQPPPMRAMSKSQPQPSTSADGTIFSCGARSRTIWACGSGEVRNTRAVTSASSSAPGHT